MTFLLLTIVLVLTFAIAACSAKKEISDTGAEAKALTATIDRIDDMYNTKYGSRKDTESEQIIKRIEEERKPKKLPKFVFKDIELELFNDDGVFKTIYKTENPKYK